MILHDVHVYHCQCCGKVVNREHDQPVPSCCGESMELSIPHLRYTSESEEPCTTDEAVRRSGHPRRP